MSETAKDKTHVIELKIPSELGYEKLIRELAGAVARQMGFEPERVEDLQTAVAEACANAIEHGNQLDANAPVWISLIIYADRLAIEIRDEGRGGPPPNYVPEPDITRKIIGRETLRHMGIFLIHHLVDEASFVETETGDGNQFRIVMHLHRQRELT
jgi:serine/threonine-protein kinase RsbW